MRDRILRLLAAAAVIGLSACTPDRYVESPTMTAYFKGLVPDAREAALKTVSVCSANDTWYTTVLFADGLLYHYQLNLDDQSVTLASQSTPDQRSDGSRLGRGDELECVGEYEENWTSLWKTFVPSGSYRFKVGLAVRGQVRKSIVLNDPFDDAIKKRLNGAALAVRNAIKLHARFVPAQKSWGIQP